MLNQLVNALVGSGNEAADDVLLEALRLGTEPEKALALSALLRRKTNHGLGGVIGQYDSLPQALQLTILRHIRILHHALSDCGRGDDVQRRLSAMKLIALGRQGKLTYVLSESLHSDNAELSRGAVEAIVALARWVSTETRRLQRASPSEHETSLAPIPSDELPDPSKPPTLNAVYHQLAAERADIEQAVARAMDVHRGTHGADLLRAALLLSDWPQSKCMAILHTTKHGGQSPMVRRLQQPPDSEHAEAFLMAASHCGLRSHFGVVFSHVAEAPVLDALLRKTHWLKDHQLQLCMRQVDRGAWFGDAELMRDLSRRDPADAGKIGEWLSVSALHDVVQDERMDRLRQHAGRSFEARLQLLRCALRRPRGASVALLKNLLSDPDERIARLAAREFVRRRPADFENVLLQLMTSAPASVRRVVSRSVGQSGFEQFWQRFDRLDRATRKAAGKAMLKILPDGLQRLSRRLIAGPPAQQIKAITIAQDLDLIDTLAPALQQLCEVANPKVRSKAVAALRDMATVPSEVLLDRVLADSDARVRANAIEVLESRKQAEYVPLLAQRARSAHNRERANAIKAMHRMRVSTATSQLANMLGDDRPEHRISALWTLKQIGWWRLLSEVARIAKSDTNMRVRRYALGVLRDVAEVFRQREAKAV